MSTARVIWWSRAIRSKWVPAPVKWTRTSFQPTAALPAPPSGAPADRGVNAPFPAAASALSSARGLPGLVVSELVAGRSSGTEAGTPAAVPGRKPPAAVAASCSSVLHSGSSSAARSTRLAMAFTAPWMSSRLGRRLTLGTTSSSSTSKRGRTCRGRPPGVEARPAGRRVRRLFMAPSEARMLERMAM